MDANQSLFCAFPIQWRGMNWRQNIKVAVDHEPKMVPPVVQVLLMEEVPLIRRQVNTACL